MENNLNELERRVFGVLLEKSLAQPTYYPMTPNAIVAACNQKSNRDPFMDLDEDAVWDTLERLRGRGLVAKVLAPLSMRADRFKHEAREYFGWEKPERAVMAELLLRGPQSIGELKTRCSRMVPFEDKAAVGRVLESLQQADPPLVQELPRTGGRSAVRFVHRLYPEGETPAVEDAAARVREGGRLADSLGQSGLIPAPALTLVRLGEESGQLESLLLRTADIYGREVRTPLKRLIAIVEPAMILFLGALIGAIILSVLVAITGLYDLAL